MLEDLSTWTGLIEQYPDNFVAGSDAVGRYEGSEGTVRRYDRLLSRLTTGAAKKVARDNIPRIMSEDGTTLDPGYVYAEEAYTRRGSPDRSVDATISSTSAATATGCGPAPNSEKRCTPEGEPPAPLVPARSLRREETPDHVGVFSRR